MLADWAIPELLQVASEFLNSRERLEENHSEVLADWAVQETPEIRQAASEFLDPREGLEETHSQMLVD